MKVAFALVCTVLILNSCTHARLDYPAQDVNNRSLNTLAFLQPGDTTLQLANYIKNPSKVDSVTLKTTGTTLKLNKTTGTVQIHTTSSAVGVWPLKIYVGGIPFTVPCAFTNKTPETVAHLERNDSAPLLLYNKYNLNTVTLSAPNGIKTTLALWQNYVLPPDLCLIQPKQMLLAIPEEALKIQRSYMRVWISNRNGVSQCITIPLAFGKAVADSSQWHHDDQLKLSASVNAFTRLAFADKLTNRDTINDLHKFPYIERAANQLIRKAAFDPMFVYGNPIVLQQMEQTKIVALKYFDRELLLFINKSSKARDFKLTLPEIFISKTFRATYGTAFSFDEHIIKITLPAYSAEILQ